MEIYLKNKEEIVVRNKTELGENVSKILDYMESEDIKRLEIQGLVITKRGS